MRSLDAIHLATARSPGELAGLVTYDGRLRSAPMRARVKVWAPA
jgi:predicted nucleic acid-binding protein